MEGQYKIRWLEIWWKDFSWNPLLRKEKEEKQQTSPAGNTVLGDLQALVIYHSQKQSSTPLVENTAIEDIDACGYYWYVVCVLDSEVVWEKKVSLHHPLRSLAGSQNETDGYPLTGQKHIYWCNINFMWHGKLHKEMKTQRNSETWVFLC